MIFQTWILLGANLTASQRIGTDGRLPMSIDGCMSAINISQPLVMNETYYYFHQLNINTIFLSIDIYLVAQKIYYYHCIPSLSYGTLSMVSL